MMRVSRFKKILLGTGFLGAFFFAAPAADAQEMQLTDPHAVLSQAAAGIAGAVAQVESTAAEAADAHHSTNAAWSRELAGAKASVQEAFAPVQTQVMQTATDYGIDPTALPVANVTPQGEGQPTPTASPAPAASPEPLTNPEPLGLASVQAQQAREVPPIEAGGNYRWKTDPLSKIAAGKPLAQRVLHRVPGSFFDAPTAPEEATAAAQRGKAVFGPGTPLYVGPDTLCTLTASGYDAAGTKVGITAGHCGTVGQAVQSADAWQPGEAGTVVSTNDYLDYSVIEFNDTAELSRSYNGVTAHGVGGATAPGDYACKRGMATGTTCGRVFLSNEEVQVAQICAMQGDSGAPVFRHGRIVGVVTGGAGRVACRTPLQGALHAPTTVTRMDAIVADLNRKGGPGAGFTLV